MDITAGGRKFVSETLRLPHKVWKILAAVGDQERTRIFTNMLNRTSSNLVLEFRRAKEARAGRQPGLRPEIVDTGYRKTSSNIQSWLSQRHERRIMTAG